MTTNRTEVRQFILNNIHNHAQDIALLLVKEYGFTRQRAHQYLMREVNQGTIVKIGSRRWTRYFLTRGTHINFSIDIGHGQPQEDQVWSKYIKPMMEGYPRNVINICTYVFTEMFNNAIDHSGGHKIYTEFSIEGGDINIQITDNGIGIFQKIQDALKLETKREAILHLSKGKFTTDPSKHSGEGIFFSSRMMDKFSILSDDMYYSFHKNDWFLSSEKVESFGKGTLIRMSISKSTDREARDIFEMYRDKEIGFGKTIVAVALSADPGDPHVSRSQAKRLMFGLEKFRTVVLDFTGVESVGQAFVDEVFRVFKNEHPDIKIHCVNENQEVKNMILRGTQSL